MRRKVSDAYLKFYYGAMGCGKTRKLQGDYYSKLEEGLTVLTDKLVGILILFAKTGCLGMGLKEMVICLLNGGNIKEASVSGLGYWIGYIFLQLYPYLYELVEGLTF